MFAEGHKSNILSVDEEAEKWTDLGIRSDE